MMQKLWLTSFLILAVHSFANEPLPTAEKVDISRYVGKWYSIASLPQFFTRNCVSQSADYGIIDEKTISITNTCFKKNGKVDDIKGQAIVVDPNTNARLEVTFNSFWTKLFRVKGEYVIIKLSKDYDTVMVGTTNRKSLWIMSRTPDMSPEVLADYKSLAAQLGYPVVELE